MGDFVLEVMLCFVFFGGLGAFLIYAIYDIGKFAVEAIKISARVDKLLKILELIEMGEGNEEDIKK